MNGTGGPDPASEPSQSREALEHRLRAALDARALSLGWSDLRAASPPSARAPGTGFARGTRVPARAAAALLLLAVAAVVAYALLALGAGRQVEPARSPTPRPCTAQLCAEEEPRPSAPGHTEPAGQRP
ncbi:hypothetical protein O7599_15935 [Streptomyces sp. WMMC500]|uniref:hypothetical protein n=1 Tax=Streptomyces sp. WMMC500 TaxID=3015154 RepID=UPI00248D3A63|nr:hypothetical protein [Streptomyces sp. WMMC500]WBB63914.1 hypothetical protein O7599_15935 [Streptomyces sp. WMMC500]